MPVLLANLAVRTPAAGELEQITRLIITCDIAQYGAPDSTIEDLLSDWQGSSFNLETDAWVIVTTKGDLVGFACVWDKEHEQLSTFLCVHPDYRSRGIGTLLLRLAEERARQHVRYARPGARVALTDTVSDCNEAAKGLLEQEGYLCVRTFWRMLIEMDESFKDYYQRGKLKVELVLDSQGCMSTKQPFTRNGNYVARQYRVYEKELRAARSLQVGEEPITSLTVGCGCG
jgi:ribosomal protein S18 acetylase RimI-like enzyme